MLRAEENRFTIYPAIVLFLDIDQQMNNNLPANVSFRVLTVQGKHFSARNRIVIGKWSTDLGFVSD